MQSVGLIPSVTGEPGSKETGRTMTHYIEQGGGSDKACTAHLAKAGAILYHDRVGDEETRRKKAASKINYTCPECGLNAWAKPDAHLMCGDCGADGAERGLSPIGVEAANLFRRGECGETPLLEGMT